MSLIRGSEAFLGGWSFEIHRAFLRTCSRTVRLNNPSTTLLIIPRRIQNEYELCLFQVLLCALNLTLLDVQVEPSSGMLLRQPVNCPDIAREICLDDQTWFNGAYQVATQLNLGYHNKRKEKKSTRP